MFTLSIILTVAIILIRIACLTLVKLNIPRWTKLQKSPNTVGIIGIWQPFSDAVHYI